VAPGYSSEIIHVFAASDLQAGRPHTDPDENVVARLFSPREIRVLVAEDAVDIKTVAGLALSGVRFGGDGAEP
jgi:hypothetical protein